jgi:tetratricopeptide (TPR) repeat protein
VEGVTSAATGAEPDAAEQDTAQPYGLRQHFDVLNELADCYAERGQGERAADLYRQAADLLPDDPAPAVGLGTLAVRAGRLDEAAGHFRAALETDPACADAHAGLAMVHQRQGHYDEALDAYLQCLQRDQDNLVALLGLFQTSCQMGTFEKIIHYLQVYLDRHPGDTSVLFCLASLYVKEDRLEDARQTLLTVLALEPDKEDAERLLGDVEQRLAGRAQQVQT